MTMVSETETKGICMWPSALLSYIACVFWKNLMHNFLRDLRELIKHQTDSRCQSHVLAESCLFCERPFLGLENDSAAKSACDT